MMIGATIAAAAMALIGKEGAQFEQELINVASVINGQVFDNLVFISKYFLSSSFRSSSDRIAFIGHSGSQRLQSMHSSGFITRKFGPS